MKTTRIHFNIAKTLAITLSLALLSAAPADARRKTPARIKEGAKIGQTLQVETGTAAIKAELLLAGDVTAIEQACKNGANLKVLSKPVRVRGGFTAETPLELAVAANSAEAVRLLAAYGAPVKGTGRSLLGWGIRLHAKFSVLQTLIRLGAGANESFDGTTPLCAAAGWGNDTLVSLLLTEGPDVNALDAKGRSALDLAVGGEHCETVKLLLAAGAKVDTKHFFTALQTGNQELTQMLIQHGDMNVNCVANVNGMLMTPLAYASFLEDQDMVTFLLEKGASPEGIRGTVSPLTAAARTNMDTDVFNCILNACKKSNVKVSPATLQELKAVIRENTAMNISEKDSLFAILSKS